ncbi:Cell division cycle 7-related protein kinase [Frankliniella fusca]|uniref:non-specific serine/threonine protein kinase n=1 Tax=Frankliniella fusca TaxID=407009 RepID=A0AAE1L5X7_9NEOP|nr:Cell division cycle 7-related protein kinase [Frankliniella fusca]
MEVLTSYPHHQLGANLNADMASQNLYGGESSQACGNEVSLKHPTSYSHNVSMQDGDMDHGGESEVGVKVEKDSDAAEGSHSTSASKSTKKLKEQAQIDYLLSSLPVVDRFFNVHSKIGEGTFSSVFAASLKDVPQDSSLHGRQFAIKHLIPTTHPTRAERELKCLQDIGGTDNVVGVHFCMRFNDSIAFIMPYLPHKRFHEYVMDMGVAETRNYMKQLLLALRRVHSFNIIHRDVKPSNFLYDREKKQFLLVDFGLSQPVEETSKISPSPQPLEETRKRKREKETLEDLKDGCAHGAQENPAKRPALALNNSTNIIKTPEKKRREINPSKSAPQVISNRAKILQSITCCSNAQKTATGGLGTLNIKSPVKDTNDPPHGRKSIRNKSHVNNENMSPLKFSGLNATMLKNTKTFRTLLEELQAKEALDLRKTKADTDLKPSSINFRPAQRSHLQRKITFDDVPEDFKKTAASSSSMTSPYVCGPSGFPDPLTLSPVDQNGVGKEFRTLAPGNVKDDIPGSSIVRVQNSQVKSQQMSPITPSESRSLKVPPQTHADSKVNDKDHKVVFAKPHVPSASGSLHRPNTPSSPLCNCVGRLQVCSKCLSKKPHNAPRAGTPGFRPPEVLLRSQLQTTAVDMWAVGVILLCILSGCYPFFRSPDDLTALAEIMTIFGTEKIKETAKRLARMVVCSQPSQPLDLKKLCTRMRQRRKGKSSGVSSNSTSEKCQNCCQPLGNPDNCVCLKEEFNALLINPKDVCNIEESDDIFPDSAYHLLARLLDLDATTRISAAQALEHPFVTGISG